jgi:hypothetical protein
MTKTSWHIRDLIDLEYLLTQDAQEDPMAPVQTRDRNIFLDAVARLPKDHAILPRRTLLKVWLEARRQSLQSDPDNPVLPGQFIEEVYRLFAAVLVMTGIAFGAGIAHVLLRYNGTQPLNVATYLGTVLLPQLLLLSILGAGALLGRRRSGWQGSVLYRLIVQLVVRTANRLRDRGLKTISASRRDALMAASGMLRGKTRLYGSLLIWPAFMLAQIFAVCFNLGVIGATLLRLAGSDVAFGWQSTLQVGAKAVFTVVKAIAWPWAFLVPETLAHPSLSQIEGSRMILKDGIYRLATSDLVSWWPFLCLAIVCYGLVPRMLLLAIGAISTRKKLARLPLDHASCDAVIYRMQTPSVVIRGEATGQGPASEPESVAAIAHDAAAGTAHIALIPEELYEGFPQEVFRQLIFRKWGYRLNEMTCLPAPGKDALPPFASHGAVWMIQEAWQPPIRETLDFLAALRRRLGAQVPIFIGLIGRPEADTMLTPVTDADFGVWRRKVASLADPYLQVERLKLS